MPRKIYNPQGRNYVVVLSNDNGRKVYIGDIGSGNQGVRKLSNAKLYTRNGASRLAGQFLDAKIERVGDIPR